MNNKDKILMIFCIALTAVGVAVCLRLIIDGPKAPAKSIEVALPTTKVSPSPISTSSISTSPISTSPIPTPAAVPQITAKAYLIGDLSTGKVLKEYNSSKPLPVASMSKLLTALVATTMLAPTTTITITQPEIDGVPTDGADLKVGETFNMSEILYPLLLSSSNVAAEAIASSRPDFMSLMSSLAWEIGATTAYFDDPSGLSTDNVASAIDLFNLAKYLYEFRPDILAITRTSFTSVATTTNFASSSPSPNHGAHIFTSTHPFVSDTRFIGGKTGRTIAAGETMLTILRIGKEPIAFIVLGSDFGARESDTKLLVGKI